jgi:ABC-type Zn2+ transport system substrate-binding protein/surface adhesin
LESYFKDIEHMRRENYLFESYFMRLEKEYAKNDEDDKKKKDKKKEEKKVNLYLTPEEKYEIAQQEAEALKETIEKGRIKSDAILETLRAILEETDMAIAEIRKDAYDFQREILMGGENSRTGNIEAERI